MMAADSDLEMRRQEAAAWFSRLNQRRVSTDDIKAFSVWRRDPANARAYERVESVWTASQALAADPDISALTAEALGRVPQRVRARSMVSGLLKPLGGAAAVLIVGALVATWAFNRPLTYATAVGVQRTVRLADGSQLTLDTDTLVQVRLRNSERSVTLAKGQAYFDVEGDAARPFKVWAGDASVTAIGTRFDVRRLGSGARVTLVEGRIDVTNQTSSRPTWTLQPGQQIVTTVRQPVVTRVDTARETSWTNGRLIFENTPIRTAVAEVNRYSTRKIDLQAASIAGIPVSGAFDTGDVEGFVAALGDLYPVTIQRQTDSFLIVESDGPSK